MAYKFQIGAATLSGSVTHKELATFSSGLGANEQNILNVGTLRLDTLQADDASIEVSLADNQAAAFDIKEGSTSYLKFVTSDGSEQIDGGVDLNLASGKVFGINNAEVLSADGAVKVQSGVAGAGLAHSSGVLSVQVSGALKLANDKIGLSGSIAGSGLTSGGGADSIDELRVDIGGLAELAHADIADADEMMIDDSGTLKKVGVDSLRDHFFGAVSGDATIADGGALTIAADSVEGTMLNTNAADGSTLTLSSDSLSVLKVPNALTAGTGIDAGGTFDGAAARTISITAAQTAITSVLNDSLKIGRGDGQDSIDFGVDNQIQFDINNGAIMDVTSNGLNIAKGGIQLSATSGVIDVDSAKALTIGSNVGVNNLTLGASGTTVVIPGNLTVSGTTVEVDAAFVVTSSVKFEGATPDGNEIELTSADPTADRTITLPDLSGHVPLLADAATAASIAVTAAEFAILDGGTSDSSVTIANTDQMIINDGGVMKQTAMSDLRAYIGSPVIDVANKSNGQTLEVGINYFNNHGGAISANMPASNTLSNGDIIRIKAGPDCSSTNTLTINANGDQTFDATLTSLVLESPNAAISLIVVDVSHDDLRIM